VKGEEIEEENDEEETTDQRQLFLLFLLLARELVRVSYSRSSGKYAHNTSLSTATAEQSSSFTYI